MFVACTLAMPLGAKTQVAGEADSIPFANTICVEGDSPAVIITKAAHVVPTPNQLAALKNEFIAFVHFGPNTFTRREWGTGMEDPAVFNLKELDTDQWCRAMKAAGIKLVLITAKHHDGFVLWQSRYTRHGVMSSPFRGGKGDIVKDLSESCRKYGIKLGIYLSPADLYQIENPEGLYGNLSKYTLRTIPCEVPGRPFKDKRKFQFVVDDYNEYFLNQLFELLTEYGPIAEVWFDGAHPKRKGGQTYNYAAWKKLIHTLAPQAVIFGREDVRWCGNEAGMTRDTEWNVIPYSVNPDTASHFSDMTDIDLGSREQLYKGKYLHYQQAEVNTSIREGWFYRDDTQQRSRSADDVFDIYERAVGGNATFLLNIPPNRDGRFSDVDVAVLEEVGKRIRQTYGNNLLKGAQGPSAVLDGSDDTYIVLDKQKEFVVTMPAPVKINRIMLQEAVATRSERVEKFAVDARIDGEWQEIATATNIGYKRLLRFPEIETDGLRFRLLESRLAPAVSHISAYYYDAKPPQLEVLQDAAGRVTIRPKLQDFGWKSHHQNAAENLNAGYKIYYTTDGTEPDETSALYTSPLPLEGCVVKAVAMLEGERGAVCTEQLGLAKSSWKLYGVSSEAEGHAATAAFDANPQTYWSTEKAPLPHFISIDLGETKELNGFAYLPQTAKSEGMMAQGVVSISRDGKKWEKIGTFEFGNLVNDPSKRFYYFPNPVSARYVRIGATGTEAGSPVVSVAELDFIAVAPSASLPVKEEAWQDEPRAYWLPDYVRGVDRPVISLNGEWEFRYSAQSEWTSIQVPGEAVVQGYAIRHDVPFYYRRIIQVPEDYKGNKVILRFDGTYSKAKLYVNGTLVRQHAGGFTRWETDITSYVKVGAGNELMLELVDPLDDISYASGYAHHPVGGILRDVTLFAVPLNHLYDEVLVTELDSLYQDAVLDFTCRATTGRRMDVRLSLFAPDGKKVKSGTVRLGADETEASLEMDVASPLKWDAEHPNLYEVKVDLLKGGRISASYTRQIGFREIEIQGNRMLVNGLPVKLRGACRHDISPSLGRATTAEIDSLDAVLFKEANMNFVRTSHYPPTEHFVNFCDRYGIYVECETAVCFVNTHRQKNYASGASQDEPAYADWYLSQCQEMVRSMRNHPSVLFWSIGNESTYGANFQQCYDYVKGEDPTRPVIFSYPGSVPEGHKVYDLVSMHYQDVNGNLDQWGVSSRRFQALGLPTIFDEWAHPACYTYATLQTDPNIREFWGKSLDMMWSGLFEAPGGLGGAIWGYVDETFALPEPKVGDAFWKEFAHTAKPEGFRGNCVGYGEWGIVDVWRRKKPEFYATKKAYSPVRLEGAREVPFTPGLPLTFTLYNRFDHTNLSEVNARYQYKGVEKELSLPAVAPHAKGVLTIPGDAWEEGETVSVEFYTAAGQLIDVYCLTLGKEQVDYPQGYGSDDGTLQVMESDQQLLVRGEGFEIPFDKESGLMTNITVGGKVWMKQGPFLNLYVNLNHLSGAEVRKMADHYEVSASDWKKTSLTWKQEAGSVLVDVKGTYRQVRADYLIRIEPSGRMTVAYQVSGAPNGYLRESGLAFRLADSFDRLSWQRKGYWSCYPADAMSGNEGAVPFFNASVPAYGQRPQGPWAADTHNYYYWSDRGANVDRPLTQAAKAMKENIFHYSLLATGGQAALSVLSEDASVACRLNKLSDGQLMLYANNRWDYPEIAWGNYCKQEAALPCFGRIVFQLSKTR